LQAINRQLNPESGIEIAIDAVGASSFRAKLKTSASKVTGLFKRRAPELVIGVLAAFIYEKLFSTPIQVVVRDDSYIVQHGADRIVLPKAVYDATKALPRPEEVDRHITRAFDVLEEDPSVTELGLTPHIADQQPVAIIPRASFGQLSKPGVPNRPTPRSRSITESAQLVVVRAVLERSDRKWQFIWNGHRISAPIKDQTFFDRLAARQFEFGQGDTLGVELAIHQTLDEASGAYINDYYEVVRVVSHTPGPKQKDLLSP
jgi:hypothetical protein